MLRWVTREVTTAVRSAIGAIEACLRCRALRYALIAVVISDALVLSAFVAWAAAEHFYLEDSYFYRKAIFSSFDWSLMEISGYMKEVACALMLGLMTWKTRSSLFAALTFFIVAILADDALRLHETIGRSMVVLGIPKWISQSAAAGITAVLPVALLVITWIRANEGRRRAVNAILVPIAVLLFFAVGVDTVHELVKEFTNEFGKVFALFEDGGELLCLTLLTAVVAGVFLRVSRSPDLE